MWSLYVRVKSHEKVKLMLILIKEDNYYQRIIYKLGKNKNYVFYMWLVLAEKIYILRENILTKENYMCNSYGLNHYLWVSDIQG